jgi:N-acetylneuraminic acid mutarotase
MTRLAILGLLLLCLATAQVQTPGEWVKLAPFPEPSDEVKGVSAGGKLYVFGGVAPGFKPRGLAYEYDPAVDRWAKKKQMPVPSVHTAFADLNGGIYAFGGFAAPASQEAGFVPIDNAWQYDPATDVWKALAPMPSKRGGAVAAAVGGKIYVIGGASLHPGSSETVITPGSPHRSVPYVEEYDPSANSWRVRSPMPTARVLASVGAVDGKIYVIGGRLGAAFMRSASNTDLVEEYDPAADSWGAVRARMPTPRSVAAWGTYGGKIYVAGGEAEDANLSVVYRTVEAYDPAKNQWMTAASMAVERFGLAGAIIGDRLHLVSGLVQAGTDVPAESPSHDALALNGK